MRAGLWPKISIMLKSQHLAKGKHVILRALSLAAAVMLLSAEGIGLSNTPMGYGIFTAMVQTLGFFISKLYDLNCTIFMIRHFISTLLA